MRFHIAILVAAGTFFAAGPAYAACQPEFSQASQTVTLNAVEIGAGEQARETFQIRVRNRGEDQCPATIRFAREPSAPLDPSFAYQLVAAAQVIEVLPDEIAAPAPRSDVFIPGISAGASSVGVPIQLTLPTEWGIASGTRRETLVLLLVDENENVIDRMLLHINITIPPTVELRIVGATGSNRVVEVDLGSLEPEQMNFSDPFAARIWSTAPYTVSFESENRGALVHSSASDRIPYTLEMDGAAVDLTGAIPVSFGSPTGSLGNLHPLRIVVAPFTARAGDYGDRVRVTVTAS